MTWHTQYGDRILLGAEAALFRAMVDDLHEQIRHIDREDFPIDLFENMTPNSQVALLLDVTHAMLWETESCPALTAVNEAAIATIFGVAFESLTCELDLEEDAEIDRFYWRRLVYDAYAELDHGDDSDDGSGDLDEPASEPLKVESENLDEWGMAIEILSDLILWDADYLDSDLFLDSPPSSPRPLSEDSGGYFTAIPPDPRDSEMEGIHAALNALCRPTPS